MSADELTWEPPGPGQWYPSPEHMPTPVTRLFAELFPQVAIGWSWGAERYGLPPNHGTFGAVNCWFFYSPGRPGAADVEALDRAAAETLASQALDRLTSQVARGGAARGGRGASRALLAEDLAAHRATRELADHVERAIEHFLTNGPEHFASVHGAAAAGALCQAAAGWGLDLPERWCEALAGQADASTSAEQLFDRIAAGLRAAGNEGIDSLDEVRDVGGDAAAALHELLEDYGWRIFDNDLIEPTLAESPDARRRGDPRRARRAGTARPTVGRRRARSARRGARRRARPGSTSCSPMARAGYGINDDNTTVLFAMPLGLVRRAVLEVGRRLEARGRIDAARPRPRRRASRAGARSSPATGPSRAELAARAAARVRRAGRHPAARARRAAATAAAARSSVPTAEHSTRCCGSFHAGRVGAGRRTRLGPTPPSGEHVVRGRAVVGSDPTDALLRMEPGDVLVARHHHGVVQHDLPGGWRRSRCSTAGR